MTDAINSDKDKNVDFNLYIDDSSFDDIKSISYQSNVTSVEIEVDLNRKNSAICKVFMFNISSKAAV